MERGRYSGDRTDGLLAPAPVTGRGGRRAGERPSDALEVGAVLLPGLSRLACSREAGEVRVDGGASEQSLEVGRVASAPAAGP